MSYLSRITLKTEILKSSQLGHLIAGNAYGMHRLLWDLFPDQDGQKRNFLFREERDQTSGSHKGWPVFYLLSASLPTQDQALFTVESRVFAPQLDAAETLSFKLRANPVVSRRQEGKKHSISHDVVMDAQYQLLNHLCQAAGLPATGSKSNKLQLLRQLPAGHLSELIGALSPQQSPCTLDELIRDRMQQAQFEWLRKRGEQHGFVLESSMHLQATGYEWKPLPEKGRNAGFSSVDFEGRLTVLDPERFIQMLNSGLGKARAFGCGLMLVRRV